MATLTIPNTFSVGGVIRAGEHNANMNAILSWSTQISNDNITTLTGVVTWSTTTNVLCISSTNTGTEGSVTFAHNGTLASGKSLMKLTSNAAQAAGTAGLEINMSNVASNIPALKVTDAGAGAGVPALEVVSTTKASIPAPKMTTTQRNAVSSPVAGMLIFNTTLARLEMHDGTNWVDAAGRTGEIVSYGGATPSAYMLECDGSAVSRTTYAGLFARLGEAWGEGDGATTFNLPDLRGRFLRGQDDGAGRDPDAGSRTAANTGGNTGDNVGSVQSGATASHTHSFSATTSTDGSHAHGPASPASLFVTDTGGGGIISGGGAFGAQSSTTSAGSHSHTLSGTSGSTGGNETRPINANVKFCIII